MAETLVDQQWLESNFPCRTACPVGTEAGRYVALIEEGRFREAYAVARRPNPLASICGRICAAPCESACRRGVLDAPVAIRALKRFVTERFGVESMIDLETLEEIYGKRSRLYPDDPVAIIGAGPAGLAAAHDLALQGYPVTLFEAQPVPGGMLRLGIPEYRLPRELIKLEINAILSLGVDLQLGQRLGTDFSISDLREQGFKAVFLGIGAHRGRDLHLPGASLDGVLNGVDFLLNSNMGYRLELGQRIAVVGGGNVALDVARTAIRSAIPGEHVAADINIVTALDVARTALRFGVREVNIFSLESIDEMPADLGEIAQAEEEGVIFHTRRGPKEFLGSNGRFETLVTLRCNSIFDDRGRFSPSFDKGSEESFDADTVILAVGQQSDLSFLSPEDGIETEPGDTISIDPETLQTTAPDVFSGGDAAFGPRIAINAIADGRMAAASIHKYLRGEELKQRTEGAASIVIRQLCDYTRVPDFEGIPRQSPYTLPIERRIGIAEIEGCLTEDQAGLEASRCLHCWVNTVFEENPVLGTECILCGGCADVCPEECIEFVPISEIDVKLGLMPEIRSDFQLDSEAFTIGEGVALIKDETICIRCGLCAQRCPAGTIRMEAFSREESGDAAV